MCVKSAFLVPAVSVKLDLNKSDPPVRHKRSAGLVSVILPARTKKTNVTYVLDK